MTEGVLDLGGRLAAIAGDGTWRAHDQDLADALNALCPPPRIVGLPGWVFAFKRAVDDFDARVVQYPVADYGRGIDGGPPYDQESPTALAHQSQPDDWRPYEGPRGGTGWERTKKTPPPPEQEKPPAEPPPAAAPPPPKKLTPQEESKARMRRNAQNIDIDGTTVRTSWGDELTPAEHKALAQHHRNQAGEAKDYNLNAAHWEMVARHESEKEFKGAANYLFGRNVSRREVGEIFGAADDPDLEVSLEADAHGTRIAVELVSPRFRAEREIAQDRDGNTYVKHGNIHVVNKGQGFGSAHFAGQVGRYQKAGISYIKAHAARGPALNGYNTWPLLGYDQGIPEREAYDLPDEQVAAHFDEYGGDPGAVMESVAWARARVAFPEARTVLDILETPEGEDWWRENGTDLHDATFDLLPGSRSMKRLEAYDKRSAARKARRAARQQGGQPGA